MSLAFSAATIGLLGAGFVMAASPPASAADATVPLGAAASYAVLAATTVTNTGNSVISGNLGVNPGSAVTGFPPGQVVNGTTHAADAESLDAQSALTLAYVDAAGRPMTHDLTGQDLAGMTLTPGVYEASSSMALTGTVTLDAQGDPAAVFIFKSGSSLVTASGSRVQVINDASACNVFWKVGSSATLGTSTDFVGTIMAQASTTLEHAAKVEGRVLARDGAVTLDDNVITTPDCSQTPGGTGGGGTTPTASTTPRTGASTPGGSGSDHKTRSTPTTVTTTPVIPTGHPSTGAHPVSSSATGRTQVSSTTALFVLAGLAAAAALASAVLGFGSSDSRRRRS